MDIGRITHLARTLLMGVILAAIIVVVLENMEIGLQILHGLSVVVHWIAIISMAIAAAFLAIIWVFFILYWMIKVSIWSVNRTSLKYKLPVLTISKLKEWLN